ncbi:MAG: hypothetical protein DI603_12970 [Roseateles depolymerans]|uniref:PEP-CTERM protein-sorting domain-containing protein n=1 Tax=Roseateles depolymerans TaxID=76731 RepID=A0A2W5DKU5_9BURK|nr:MAG: hypothetical protein DI603_12970 [Roseateles depolymerans]
MSAVSDIHSRIEEQSVKSPLLRTMTGLALGVCTAISAQAATASASLSNVHLQLIDLDPNDGITAAISFNGDTSTYNNAYWSLNGSYQAGDWQYAPGLGVAIPAVAVSGVGFSASASSTAGDLFQGAGWGGSAQASAVTAGVRSTAYAETYAGQFTLAPHTLLVLMADSPAATVSAALGEYASASAYLSVQSLDGSTQGSAYAQAYINADGAGYSNAPSFLQVSFVNLSGTAISGYLYGEAYAYASAAPVPEPGSAALMLGGLLGAGALLRRRARR